MAAPSKIETFFSIKVKVLIAAKHAKSKISLQNGKIVLKDTHELLEDHQCVKIRELKCVTIANV